MSWALTYIFLDSITIIPFLEDVADEPVGIQTLRSSNRRVSTYVAFRSEWFQVQHGRFLALLRLCALVYLSLIRVTLRTW